MRREIIGLFLLGELLILFSFSLQRGKKKRKDGMVQEAKKNRAYIKLFRLRVLNNSRFLSIIIFITYQSVNLKIDYLFEDLAQNMSRR